MRPDGIREAAVSDIGKLITKLKGARQEVEVGILWYRQTHILQHTNWQLETQLVVLQHNVKSHYC